MNHKTKSLLYFVSLVLAVVAYYNTFNMNETQHTHLVENTIDNVSSQDALN